MPLIRVLLLERRSVMDRNNHMSLQGGKIFGLGCSDSGAVLGVAMAQDSSQGHN